MGSKILYKVETNAAGHFTVSADDLFVGTFKHSADAYDFIDMARKRDERARNALNYGTLGELEAQNPDGFRNP